MISERTRSVAERSKEIYETELRADCERRYFGKFIAIEPNSSDYFVADTFGQAVRRAREAYPEEICFVIQVGEPAALRPTQLPIPLTRLD